MVEIVNLISAFMYGLSSSLTLCLASCLPVYLPILFGYGDNPKKGLNLSIGFGVGRFAGYFLLGTIAALLGATFIYFFNNIFPKISMWLILAFGFLTIFYGTLILAKAEFKLFKKNTCRTYLNKTKGANNPFVASGVLGFVSTITPCVPVFTFLLLPFALGKIWETSLITVAFGLGANVVFVGLGIFVAFGMKNIKDRFDHWKRRLEIFSAMTLIVFGLFYLIWATGHLLFDWQYQNFVLPTIFDFFNFIKSLLGM